MSNDTLVLDVWTEHDISFLTGTFKISGYSFTCVPEGWIVEETSEYRHVSIPQGVSAADCAGKNKFLQLAQLVRQYVGSGDTAEVWFYHTARRPWVRVLGLGNFILGSNSRLLAWDLGCTDVPLGASTLSDEVGFPAGTWSPRCAGAWSWEPVGVETNTRTTGSPYNARYQTRLSWGVQRRAELYADLVPAADVFSDRLLDVPSSGWAAAAQRVRGVGTVATLEGVWPWLSIATPQLETAQSWAIGAGQPRYSESWGRPAIVYLTRDLVGRGVAFRRAPASNIDYTASNRPLYDDTLFRHVMIDDGTQIQDVLEARVGINRAYLVQIPFLDVTWPAITARQDTIRAAQSLRGPIWLR